MKKTGLFWLALMCLAGLPIYSAKAGSAIVWDGGRNLTSSYGHPVGIAEQRALKTAHLNGWSNVRIIAATDQTGYGAIAIALHPNGRGSVIGVALGRRSAAEANSLAIEQCLQKGGTSPKVRWVFRG